MCKNLLRIWYYETLLVVSVLLNVLLACIIIWN